MQGLVYAGLSTPFVALTAYLFRSNHTSSAAVCMVLVTLLVLVEIVLSHLKLYREPRATFTFKVAGDHDAH